MMKNQIYEIQVKYITFNKFYITNIDNTSDRKNRTSCKYKNFNKRIRKCFTHKLIVKIFLNFIYWHQVINLLVTIGLLKKLKIENTEILV